jgi:hypothetical protein
MAVSKYSTNKLSSRITYSSMLAGNTAYSPWSSWTSTTLTAGRNYPFAGWGNNLFVVPEYYVPGSPPGNYGEAYAWTSSNGTSWTRRNLPSAQQWRTPHYSSGIWVIPTDGVNYVTSTDATTWTARTYTGKNAWVSASNGTTFVVASYGSTTSSYSTNGTSWTDVTMANSEPWRGGFYGAGLFFALSAGSTNVYNTTPTGATWTSRTFPNTAPRYAGAWNGTVCVVADANAASGNTSTDGINWTARTFPTTLGQGIAGSTSKGVFVAPSEAGGTGVYTSSDGITWTLRATPTGSYINNNQVADSIFVIGASNDAGGKVSTITAS